MNWIAIAIGAIFALNIGASGTAAAMGAAYGGRAVSRRTAQILAGTFALLGAVLGGGAVTKTIGQGIVPEGMISVSGAAIVLAAACITLSLANYLRIPLSTSEVTVGAVAGLGIALGHFNTGYLLFLVGLWVVFPVLAGGLGWLVARIVHRPIYQRLERGRARHVRRAVGLLLIGAGCFEAFAAGTNNVANALGPLVGAGLIDPQLGLVLGGLALGLGASTVGGRVLETNGRLTHLTYVGGAIVSLVAGGLTLAASILGLPVPLTQATTAAIAGVGAGAGGCRAVDAHLVRRILLVWGTSPVTSLMIAYLIVLSTTGASPGLELPVIVLVGSVTTSMLLRQAKELRAMNVRGSLERKASGESAA